MADRPVDPTALGDSPVSRLADPTGEVQVADADAEDPAAQISWMRDRIDEIDHSIIQLWLERAALSQRVGSTRLAAGGTRLVLSRERVIIDRYRRALGADGTQLALLILRAGRGPL